MGGRHPTSGVGPADVEALSRSTIPTLPFRVCSVVIVTIKDICFHGGLGVFFPHELDAVANHEWRVLPLTRALPDESGMMVFMAAHVPLFAVIVALVGSDNPKVRTVTKRVVSAFLILHGCLHAAFAHHPSYEFSALLSDCLIYGGMLLGAGFLAFEWVSRDDRVP